MATDWIYVRLDPKKFGHDNMWTLKQAKKYYGGPINYGGVIIAPNPNFQDEDPKHDGSGIKRHNRPVLTNLLGVYPLLPECDPSDQDQNKPTGNSYAPGDNLFIWNLSHLSTDPYVIGSLVNTIVSLKTLNLTISSLGYSSASIKTDAATRAFFSDIMSWKGLQPQIKKWKPKYKLRKGVKLLDNGGGDGGGDGGC
jgi:hypothetical protein